jgi:O-antigen ligase
MKPQKLFFLSILLFALFPILPNRLKGLPVIVFFLCSIFVFFKYKRTKKINLKKVFFFSGIYLFYLLSLFYTESFISIDKTLSTRLSLIIIPISFGFLSTVINKIDEHLFKLFSKIYFSATVLFCLVVINTIYNLEYYLEKVTINEVYQTLTSNMYGIEQHPIYASVLISIAIFLSVFVLRKTNNIYEKMFLVFGNIILLFTLFFFSRKAVILAIFLAFTIFIITNFKRVKVKRMFLITTLIFTAMILATPVVKKRFKEMFHSVTYSKISPDNSSSIRFGIYKCTIETIKRNTITGYGVGDVDLALQQCYSKTSKILVDGNYNSHNQYLGIALACGIFGLLFFVLFLYYNMKKAIQDQNKLFLVIVVFYIIVMFFENLLERQSGVIIFAFYICFFNFIKIVKTNPIALEKKDNHHRS